VQILKSLQGGYMYIIADQNTACLKIHNEDGKEFSLAFEKQWTKKGYRFDYRAELCIYNNKTDSQPIKTIYYPTVKEIIEALKDFIE
jgi:hypothetical protein